ncbi:hypothetical protein [Kribbella swartbergensis]
MTAARTAGFTCRAIAKLTGVPGDGPGMEYWRLAGRVDRLSRGGSVTAEGLKLLVPVLDQIESGAVAPPERATRRPSTSKRAEAVRALEAALAENTRAGTDKLFREALNLLGATTNK